MAKSITDMAKVVWFNKGTGSRLFFRVFILLTVVFILLIIKTGPSWSWHWQNPLLFQVVERVEFLSCIMFALFLLTRKTDDDVFKVWVPAGLLIMGILDWFSNDATGSQKIWLLSLAMAFGGLFFAIGGLPFRAVRSVYRKGLILSVVVAAGIALGTISFVLPGDTPGMLSGSRFNATAQVMNIITGLLFVAAAVFFIARYIASGNSVVYQFEMLER